MNIKSIIHKIKLQRKRIKHKYDILYQFDFDLKNTGLDTSEEPKEYILVESIIPEMKKPIFPGTKYYAGQCTTDKNIKLYIRCSYEGIAARSKRIPLDKSLSKLIGQEVSLVNNMYSLNLNKLIVDAEFIYRDMKHYKTYVYFNHNDVKGIITFSNLYELFESLLPEFYK